MPASGSTLRPALARRVGVAWADGGVVLLGLNRLGWLLTAAMFDRERLIAGTR
jgi:hypothetical protein